MILFDRWHGFDVCNEMGTIIVAVFSQMHFLSNPLEASLFAVANFCIVGRANRRALRVAHLLGSGERPVPARLDSVASRPLTRFGSPEGSKASAFRSLVGYKPAEKSHPHQWWYGGQYARAFVEWRRR